MYGMIHSTPVLESHTKEGKKKFWQGFVVFRNDGYYTFSRTWKETNTGLSSEVDSIAKRVEGKNLGKSNETSPRDQAIFNIDSEMRKKRLVGYVEEGEVSTILPLPMLAKKFEDVPVEYPVYVQPKFDGIRAMTDGTKFWSRKGKVFPHETIKHLLFDTEGHIVDGEIILHDDALEPGQEPVQQTLSAVMVYDSRVSPWLTFRMFDAVNGENLPFSKRLECLRKMVDRTVPVRNRVFMVETRKAINEKHVQDYHNIFVEDGNEGAMVRTDSVAKYEYGQKSRSLLKVKQFEDHEYEVVRVIEGEGREKGCAIFVCTIDKAKGKDGEFNVVPIGAIGSLEMRRKMYENEKKDGSYAGAMLTVKHQGYTEAGIPRFPKGKAFRPEWDR